MEGKRAKRECQDFSPLSSLHALAKELLEKLEHTLVYEFYNIPREKSLKPNVKAVKDIKILVFGRY